MVFISWNGSNLNSLHALNDTIEAYEMDIQFVKWMISPIGCDIAT